MIMKQLKMGKLLCEGDNYDNDLLWQDMTVELQEQINKKNPNGFWHVKGENLGWQKRSGEKWIKATDSNNLLFQILPKTNCSFQIYNYGKGLAITNAHHDSQNEIYYLTPCAERSYELNKR